VASLAHWGHRFYAVRRLFVPGNFDGPVTIVRPVFFSRIARSTNCSTGAQQKRPPEGGLCILELYLDHAAARRGGLSRSEDLPSIVTNLFARVDVDKDGHGTSPIGFGLLARGVGWLAGF
jgi:hypothetical protein